jgi:plasmid maintenance system killer protein
MQRNRKDMESGKIAEVSGSYSAYRFKKTFHASQGKGIAGFKIPPANRLEKLKGDRIGQYSIRINDQWRICFIWSNANASDVEIVDYHQERGFK